VNNLILSAALGLRFFFFRGAVHSIEYKEDGTIKIYGWPVLVLALYKTLISYPAAGGGQSKGLGNIF
jgi:uncharacterized membrane protein YoaT (DUF817 family)